MPPPRGGAQRRERRTSQKQQRELDAKMHQTLRSLMFAAYEREETARQETFAEAQRIVFGNRGTNATPMKEELDSKSNLKLRLTIENNPINRSDSIEPMPTPFEFLTEPSSQDLPDDEELFYTSEEKVEVREDAMLYEAAVGGESFEAALDLDVEKTVEDLKLMSLEDVCVRTGYYVCASSNEGDFKHSSLWYRRMLNTCKNALQTYEYPRPQLPFEVERELDKLCDNIDEDFREEICRNSRKFDKRNSKHKKDGGAAFECLYPVAKEDMLNNPVLLTGVSGNTGMFYKLVTGNTHLVDDQSCYPDCICYSTTHATRANVLHFAAAHGNHEFITSLLYPEKERFAEQIIYDHYVRMVTRWLKSLIAPSFSRLSPFDMAVFYDDRKCARALLNHVTANAARERKSDMASPNSSLPFRPYTESQLSLAAYHGNMDIVKMLEEFSLIKFHHYPQAFREAANAGDIEMLMKLWDMCGHDETCLWEQDQRPGKQMCTPLHVAAAAGHLRCVQFLCQSQMLRATSDAVGDLPIIYALENVVYHALRDRYIDWLIAFHAIVEYLMAAFPSEVPHALIRSAINCKYNRLAKHLFHHMIDLKEVIAEFKPMNFSVEVGNFHMAEYILKQYFAANKVSESPWSKDVSEALRAVLCTHTLPSDKKVKFVIAFQLAGFKVSMVNVLRMVSDKSVAATICNSLRHTLNQPQRNSSD